MLQEMAHWAGPSSSCPKVLLGSPTRKWRHLGYRPFESLVTAP
jgi:hypothetical protein